MASTPAQPSFVIVSQTERVSLQGDLAAASSLVEISFNRSVESLSSEISSQELLDSFTDIPGEVGKFKLLNCDEWKFMAVLSEFRRNNWNMLTSNAVSYPINNTLAVIRRFYFEKGQTPRFAGSNSQSSSPYAINSASGELSPQGEFKAGIKPRKPLPPARRAVTVKSTLQTLIDRAAMQDPSLRETSSPSPATSSSTLRPIDKSASISEENSQNSNSHQMGFAIARSVSAPASTEYMAGIKSTENEKKSELKAAPIDMSTAVDEHVADANSESNKTVMEAVAPKNDVGGVVAESDKIEVKSNIISESTQIITNSDNTKNESLISSTPVQTPAVTDADQREWTEEQQDTAEEDEESVALAATYNIASSPLPSNFINANSMENEGSASKAGLTASQRNETFFKSMREMKEKELVTSGQKLSNEELRLKREEESRTQQHESSRIAHHARLGSVFTSQMSPLATRSGRGFVRKGPS